MQAIEMYIEVLRNPWFRISTPLYLSLNAPGLTWQPRRALIPRACWPESVPAKEA